MKCCVRGLNSDGDFFELTPEEIVRQLYVHHLMETCGYPREHLDFEVQTVYAGIEVIKEKRIDIAVYEDASKEKFVLIIEVKRPEITDENAVYAPNYGEDLKEWLENRRFTFTIPVRWSSSI